MKVVEYKKNEAVTELEFRTLTKMAVFAFFGKWVSTVEAAFKYLFTKKANVECTYKRWFPNHSYLDSSLKDR